MQTALLSLHYLPDINWFINYAAYKTALIEKHENFVKSTGRNRCTILGANGVQLLTIPLQGGRDHHRLYIETKIAYNYNWQWAHWQSIKSCYGSAPYFEFYAHHFQKFYEKEEMLLFDFNMALLQTAVAVLKIEHDWGFTSHYVKVPDGAIDLRSFRNGANETRKNPRYMQVFEDRHGFVHGLSILDLIFNLGPQAKDYLLNSAASLGVK